MVILKGVVSYPIPLYSNPPIQSNFYQPNLFVISGVSLGINTTISTSVAHNFVIGQLVRLLIPSSFGCIQLNETQGYVLSIPTSTQVLVGINSSQNVDAYISSSSTTVAQIFSIGDVNTGQTNNNGINSTLNYIPGSFLNISPL